MSQNHSTRRKSNEVLAPTILTFEGHEVYGALDTIKTVGGAMENGIQQLRAAAARLHIAAQSFQAAARSVPREEGRAAFIAMEMRYQKLADEIMAQAN